MDGNLDPFAEFMWMEEQDAFDLKVQWNKITVFMMKPRNTFNTYCRYRI